jgi:preprotein translocase subunit Sec61beta
MFGRRRTSDTRWDEDNRLVLNPWAFVTVGLLVGAIVGLALLIWLL